MWIEVNTSATKQAVRVHHAHIYSGRFTLMSVFYFARITIGKMITDKGCYLGMENVPMTTFT
jgi:hypothetical protein